MKPLITVHITTSGSWRPGQQQARLLIEGLSARGHRSVIMAQRGSAFATNMRGAGFEVFEFAGSGRGPGAIWQVRRALEQLRPDVVHFHDPDALQGAGLGAWRLPIGAKIAARRVDRPVQAVWRYRHLTDRVIAVSQAVADACRSAGLVGRKVEIVHDGADPGPLRSGDRRLGRASLGISERETLLVCIAGLSAEKGHTFLLQAMPAILTQYPRTRLALVGDGPLRDELKTEAKSLGVAHSISFLGQRSDTGHLLRAADLFVMPSQLEGLGSTLIDAMLARTPIVTTYAGGIPELVGGRNKREAPVARLVPPSDPAALAAEVIEALRNPVELAALADRAETRALRSFTADRMVERTLAVYREVLAGKRGTPVSRAA